MRNIGWGRYILDGGVLHIVVHATLVADAAVVAIRNCHSFSQFFLRLSRACLGQMIIRTIKWHCKNGRFLFLPGDVDVRAVGPDHTLHKTPSFLSAFPHVCPEPVLVK